ncbi:SPOR domain-containing protein [Tepidibacillus fermentans]|uniref:Stage II sporulation protein B n=1 Tax=Tepidibacillus fermentans TaxID=1281767 RepID=A0A4R3K860_9BACI|nr:hypothetical protein [Tepidibacillus fermentans]TCS79055.1 hypothetical protein EDD72_12316 [Tepidibacillus fermentans]
MDKPRITIRLNQPNDQKSQARINNQEQRREIEGSQQEQELTNKQEEAITALEMEIRKANEIQIEREKKQIEEQRMDPEIEINEEFYQRKPRRKQPRIISWFFSTEDERNRRTMTSKPTSRPKIKSNKRVKGQYQINHQIIKTIGVGIGAIATGVLFGFILLHFFITPMMVGTDSVLTNTNVMQPRSNASVVIPQKVVYLLQSGVFTDKNGAEVAAATFKKAGKAAIVKEGNPNHVFVGIAPDKAQGEVLVELLKAEGQQTYLKPYTIKEYQANMSNETFQTFLSWINIGDQMVQWLANHSITLLKDAKITVNDTEIQKYHQQFLTEAQVVQEKLGKEGKAKEQQTVNMMIEQMNYAMTAFQQYQKTQSSQYLWNVQDSLMKYELAYETLGQ